MMMPGRSYSAENGYRYGFNGKENDNEVKGEGNQQDYGLRIYDPRLGKFLSVDPLKNDYPWYTPYQFAGNKPIAFIDLDGAEEMPANPSGNTPEGTSQTTKRTVHASSSSADFDEESHVTTKTWYWHKGGLTQGWKYDKVKKSYVEILSKAGWYSGEDYQWIFQGSDDSRDGGGLAKDLAGYMGFYFSGASGQNWTEEEKKNLSNTALGKFLGGVSEDAYSQLIASAGAYANKRKAAAVGNIDQSSFNVEDMVGLGLVLKVGIKAMFTTGAKKLATAEGEQLLLAASSNIQRHHVLPQQFRTWFTNHGISNIDDYCVEISANTHLKVVHGKGLGYLNGQWNKRWEQFVFQNANASASDIFKNAEDLLKEYGLEHLPYVPYKK